MHHVTPNIQFIGGSPAQQDLIRQAHQLAISMAQKAQQTATQGGTSFTTWFGKASKDTVSTHFGEIVIMLSNAQFTYDLNQMQAYQIDNEFCFNLKSHDGNQLTVLPWKGLFLQSSPQTIYLQAAISLIHLVASAHNHWQDLATVHDRDGAQLLAQSNPTQVVQSPRNYMYFTENVPFTVANLSVGEDATINGQLGIGTNQLTHPLTVGTSVSKTRIDYALVAGRNENNFYYSSVSYPGNESAYFEQGIWLNGGEVRVSSDKRIKTILKVSDKSHDLALLEQMQITDFRYKDQVAHGKQTKKGCIAQEVEKVYPTAVQHRKQFIPDICQMSLTMAADTHQQTAKITLKNLHGLQQGDKVKLIGDKQEFIKEVKAIVDQSCFEVSEWNEAVQEVFVYGKEVNDFRTVDYNQIFCLNVSATQALHQKIQSLENRIQQLE